MKAKAWHHLPNARLIDQVLSDLKANPEVFARTWHAAGPSVGRDAVWTAAYDAAWDAVYRVAARTAVRTAVWTALYGDAARSAAKDVAWSAIFAFIAYDDSGKYLNMPYEKLKIWAELSEDPASTLLLPYIWAKEQISPKIYA